MGCCHLRQSSPDRRHPSGADHELRHERKRWRDDLDPANLALAPQKPLVEARLLNAAELNHHVTKPEVLLDRQRFPDRLVATPGDAAGARAYRSSIVASPDRPIRYGHRREHPVQHRVRCDVIGERLIGEHEPVAHDITGQLDDVCDNRVVAAT